MIPYFVFDQINIGSVKLYTWGLFVGLGFSAGYLLLLFLAKRKNLALEKAVWLALSVFVGGFLGARLLYVLQEPQNFLYNLPLIFDKSGGGMFMGGLLGAIFLSWLCIKWKKLNFWEMADILVLPACLGIGIGRLGCFLINDHQGAITALPWGILWPDGALRHPVALYESLLGFGLFFIFWRLYKGGKKDGQLALAFLASYSGIRFLLDFTRESQGVWVDIHWGIFSVSQWVAGIIFLISLALFIHKRKC
jgi:phosphatidylglycerol:prolipoprotein diacylglycerol transferase